jgi:hypothetical protein
MEAVHYLTNTGAPCGYPIRPMSAAPEELAKEVFPLVASSARSEVTCPTCKAAMK